jgi:hypothetical protein
MDFRKEDKLDQEIHGLDQEIDGLKLYFDKLYRWIPEGAHSTESNEIQLCELGCQMERLYRMQGCDADENNDVDECLQKIMECRGSTKSLDDWKLQYLRFVDLVKQRDLYITDYNEHKRFYNFKKGGIDDLNPSHQSMWGSIRQLKFGRVVIDTICSDKGVTENTESECVELDPVFGSLLSPTGGIVGSGNTELYEGTDKDCIVMHGITHDAGGYLMNYHDIGPGYNYLHTRKTCFPSKFPCSTHGAGILFWRRFIDNMDSV